MSILRKNGLAYGTASGALILDMGAAPQGVAHGATPQDFKVVKPGMLDEQGEIATWGTDNLLPQKMVSDIEGTPVLSSTLDAKARIAIGRGPTLAKVVGINEDGAEEIEFVQDPEIQEFLDANNAFEYALNTAHDRYRCGNPFSQILMSKDRKKIIAFKREDPTQCRFEKMDDKGRIPNVFKSGDWSQYTGTGGAKTDPHMDVIPLLDRSYPYQDLRSRIRGYNFMISLQSGLFGRNYYGPAGWYSAERWVRIAMGIPEMKAAMFKNQMSIKNIVEIHPKFWENFDPEYSNADEKKQSQIQDDFYESIDELLTGGENSYKSLFSTTVIDANGEAQPGIKITAIDDKIKDGKLLPDTSAADTQILYACMMNPALVGVNMIGGGAIQSAGSGSGLREALLLQIILTEPDRRMVSQFFEIAKRYNGWPTEYVLRYPQQVMTTLNTGANSQSIA